jgi:hypothetical protein
LRFFALSLIFRKKKRGKSEEFAKKSKEQAGEKKLPYELCPSLENEILPPHFVIFQNDLCSSECHGTPETEGCSTVGLRSALLDFLLSGMRFCSRLKPSFSSNRLGCHIVAL